jgi:glyoxylase-like metal-dependent hydrolase (beta-lactamase superfamily II)
MTVAVHPLLLGWMTSARSGFLEGEPGMMRYPVPGFLCEHRDGLVMFDTGLHPDLATSPTRLRLLAGLFEVEMGPEHTVTSQLGALGIDPADVAVTVLSHLHFDHTGGTAELPDARIVVQRAEWEAALDPRVVELGGSDPTTFDIGREVQLLDGPHDLFGDGTLRIVPTVGHTPGHQSLLVDGDLMLVADACYLAEGLARDHLPELAWDRDRQAETFEALRAAEADGVQLVFSHDVDQWETLPALLGTRFAP